MACSSVRAAKMAARTLLQRLPHPSANRYTAASTPNRANPNSACSSYSIGSAIANSVHFPSTDSQVKLPP